MVQASQSTVIWTVVLASLVILMFGFFAYNNVNSKVEANKPLPVNVPSADEIATATASKIVIPAPVVTDAGSGSGATDDLLQGVYPTESHQLETDCIHDLLQDYSMNDRTDMIRDLIESKEGDNIVDLTVLDWNYLDEYQFHATNLGLDNTADRAARLTSTVRVSYRLEDGDQTIQKDKVYAVATCDNWNIRDDEFRDTNVDFSL